ncbi:type IV pilus secretin PilQ [Avibacterium sp. 21-599]|uniref:type IV pilus secretin PilQ n=1 Tax=Avibacterium sp. 21-599 TaxID=2911528 RepID=UPI002246CECB|nr:type IV pilus secretin PilQ [Avibacterium sp. 21-599]MCW9719029.1 type IV pilus secretin PilQ [Avibacterium sp. 21-599]
MRLLKCGAFFLSFSLLASASEKTDETFSIRLQQAPLVHTVQQLAAQQNVNLVIDDELQGSISLQLQQTTLAQFLQVVAKIKQLQFWQENGVYYLSKATPHSSSESANPLPIEFVDTLPEMSAPVLPSLSTMTIKLHYAKASEMMKTLTSGSGSLLSANGSISFDDRSNLLIIKDEKAILKQIKGIVTEMDKPIEQIAIEARIVTISDESLKELGVRWGIFTPTEASHKVSGSLNANGFTNITDNLNVNFATTNTPAGSVALQIAKINGRLLDLELTALERENSVEIIASPSLLTTNKKSASIKQGTEIPYVVNNSKNDSQTIEFREAVLGLDVTPHLSKDNGILLDLVVSQNAPGRRVAYGENEVIAIDKQEINTQVFAQDGETIVLGGIFHDTITKALDKVPVLGDIPVIKRLFSKEVERHQKRELVIFVTPHLIKKGQRAEKPSAVKNPPKNHRTSPSSLKISSKSRK